MDRHSICFVVALPLVLAACTVGTPELRAKHASPATGATDERALAKAQILYARGEYALAIEAFRKAIRFAPNDAAGYQGLGESYGQMGRLDLSGRYYEFALALAPRDLALRQQYARSLAKQERGDEARQLIAEIASMDATPLQGVWAVPEERNSASRTAAAPLPTMPSGRSVTIPIDPPVARAQLQLERMSMAEVALVTRAMTSTEVGAVAIGHKVRVALAPAPTRAPGAVATAKPGTTIASIRILNAVGRRGQAARMRSYLAGQGWTQAATGDASMRLAHSRVLVPGGHMDDARTLARRLPFRTALVPSQRTDRIVLVLGANATPFDNQLRTARN